LLKEPQEKEQMLDTFHTQDSNAQTKATKKIFFKIVIYTKQNLHTNKTIYTQPCQTYSPAASVTILLTLVAPPF
jgi:hypothetical protein